MEAHRTPPLFNRKTLHKMPPPFKRILSPSKNSLSSIVHKIPPKFIRSLESRINLIDDSLKSPFVEVREESKSLKRDEIKTPDGEINLENNQHKRPPLFKGSDNKDLTTQKIIIKEENNYNLKPPIIAKTAESNKKEKISILMHKELNSVPSNLYENQTGSENSHTEIEIEDNQEIGKLRHTSTAMFASLQSYKSDNYQEKDEFPLRNEVSNSVNSAIMNLQPEILEFTTYKTSEEPISQNIKGKSDIEKDENSLYSSSDYSSESELEEAFYNQDNHLIDQ